MVKLTISDDIFSADGISVIWHSKEYSIEHCHEFFEFFVVVSGSMEHVINGEANQIKKGDIFLIHPSCVHYNRFKYGECEYVNMTIRPDVFDGIVKQLCSPVITNFLNSNKGYLHIKGYNEDVDFIIRHLRKINNLDNSEDSKNSILRLTLIEVLSLFIMQDIKFKETSYPEWLELFLIKLNNIDIYTWPIEEISKMAYCSHGYLCKVFKEYTGKTLSQFMLESRIKYAEYMLINTADSVVSIANKTGFHNQSHFSKVFKKTTGLSPLQYKSRNKSIITYDVPAGVKSSLP